MIFLFPEPRPWCVANPILAAFIVLLVQGSTLQAQSALSGADVEDEVQELIPAIYWIGAEESRLLGTKVRDMINAARQLADLELLSFDPRLNYVAFAHAKDLSEQFKTWNFGATGTSPALRAAYAGYDGTVLGENIVQAFDPPLVIVHGMLRDDRARNNILSSSAEELGVGWFQNEEGRTWWVFITGRHENIHDATATLPDRRR
ncbi:MAG: CAP domain-containing protein [Rhodobacteraceae bacterium]|nr:CAP domain-containing protein [Paracoccaceae bacterium]